MTPVDLSVIIILIEELIRVHQWDSIDRCLEQVRPQDHHLTVSLAFLRMTGIYRGKLKNWEMFRDQARLQCHAEGKDPKMVLRGLL